MSHCRMNQPCQSSSTVVCFLIRHGETSRHATLRCDCRCHDDRETLFMSVDAPGFFREIEIHRDREDRSPAECSRIRDLERTAERLGTAVEITEYRRG